LDWPSVQRAAAERLDSEVSAVLSAYATERWGNQAGRGWQIVPAPAEATWRLYHLVGREAGGGYRFESLGIRATVAPDGRVVAYQVDNGQEFLALADVSMASLARGLHYFQARGLPLLTASDPPFKAPAGRFAWLRRFLGQAD
jgi:hypothetical protein